MSTRTNLWLDFAIFVAFLVAFEPALTGIAIHEWLSLAFAGAVIVHLLLHWNWITKVLARFFKQLWNSSRLNFALDVGLLVSVVTLMLSGILISRSILPTLGIQLAESRSWRFLHTSSANISLILVGLHFALHWKWIVSTVKRYLLLPVKQRLFPQKLHPAPVPVAEDPHF
jgi:hypothetical protein